MAIEGDHRKEYLSFIAVRSADIEREGILLRYVNRRLLLPKMTKVISGEEAMNATAVQGERRGTAGQVRTSIY